VRKPITLFLLLFLSLALRSLGAEERSSMEAGVYSSFGNTIFSMTDIFFNNGVIEVDIDKISRSDFTELFSGEGEAFINIFTLKPYTIGLFLGVEIQGVVSIPKEALEIIANEDGRTGNFSGELSYGASAFFDAGVRASRKYGAWRIGLEGALFSPLVYIPYSSTGYSLQTSPDLAMAMYGAFDLYSSLDLNDSTAFRNFFETLRALGFDIGASAEYEFSPALAVGGSLAHIPVIPARLRQGLHARASFTLTDFNYIHELITQDFNVVDHNSELEYSDSDRFYVIRPLRVDGYAVYRPLRTDFISVIPRAGLSFFTFYGYDKVFFNPGLEARLKFPDFLVSGLGVFYRERTWSETLSFSFNFRYLSFEFSLGLQGASFIESFTSRGFHAAFGICAGL
jgi:hypothetical protein